MKTSEVILKKVLERIGQLKLFSTSTCPASLIVEDFGIALMKGETYFLAEEDPEGVGLLLLSLVEEYYRLQHQVECFKRERPFSECATVASH